MIPWYLSLIHSNEWWASDNWWSIFSCMVVSWGIHVLASAMSGEQALSAETFFLIKMWRVQGLTSCESFQYRGMTVFQNQPSTGLLKDNLFLPQALPSSLTFIGGGCCLKVAVCRVSCFLATWSCCAAAAAAARDSGMGGSWGSVCHSAFCFSK